MAICNLQVPSSYEHRAIVTCVEDDHWMITEMSRMVAWTTRVKCRGGQGGRWLNKRHVPEDTFVEVEDGGWEGSEDSEDGAQAQGKCSRGQETP